MPKTSHAFTHFEEHYAKGADVPDDNPLVDMAPHLFVGFEPDDELVPKRSGRRVRGALINPPVKAASKPAKVKKVKKGKPEPDPEPDPAPEPEPDPEPELVPEPEPDPEPELVLAVPDLQ